MKTKPRQVRDDYLALVKRFALRPIRTEEEYDAAMKVVGAMAMRGEQDLSADEADYLEVLSELVSRYEQAHYRMPLKTGTPLERLRYMVEQGGMSASDLGRLLGSRGLGANLLAGRRELSKAHIRVLAEHFKLEPGYFL